MKEGYIKKEKRKKILLLTHLYIQIELNNKN